MVRNLEFSTFSCGGYDMNIEGLHVQVLHGNILCDLWKKEGKERETTVSAFAYQENYEFSFFLIYFIQTFFWLHHSGTGTETSQLKIPSC